MYSLNLPGEDLALPRVRARVEEALRIWLDGLGQELKKSCLYRLTSPGFIRGRG